MTEEPKMNPRVCRYLRKSRDDGEGESLQETLARHMRITEAMAADRGWGIDETYEEVVSGASIGDRPEMMRLMADMRDGRWDVVVVVDVSRLSRGDGSDQSRISNAFRLTGTRCLSDYRIYDLDNADDLELFERKLQSSRDEYKSITKRLRRGVDATVAEGYSAGGIEPYGLRRTGPKKRRTFEPNGDFENLMELFRYCHDADSPTWRGLQRHMHTLGIRSPKGREWWTTAALRYTVENPAYEGIIRWGVHQTESYLGDDYDERKRRVINEHPKVADARWPAFVDPEYARAARSRMRKGTPRAEAKRIANPLAGLLRCGKCGYMMATRPNSGNGRAYFTHPDWKRDLGCKCKSVQIPHLLDALAETMERDAANLRIALTDKGERKRKEKMEKDLARMRKDAAAGRKGLVDAYDRLDRGIIDEAMYVYITEREKSRIATLEESIAEREAELAASSATDTKEKIAHLRTMMEAVRDDSLTAEQLNSVLKQFVDHIDYWNDAPPRTRQQLVRLDIFLR